MYSQGTDFQPYESELAKQLGFDATDDWSNSDGNVTLILAFDFYSGFESIRVKLCRFGTFFIFVGNLISQWP
jgi:hypothetical protein